MRLFFLTHSLIDSIYAWILILTNRQVVLILHFDGSSLLILQCLANILDCSLILSLNLDYYLYSSAFVTIKCCCSQWTLKPVLGTFFSKLGCDWWSCFILTRSNDLVVAINSRKKVTFRISVLIWSFLQSSLKNCNHLFTGGKKFPEVRKIIATL